MEPERAYLTDEYCLVLTPTSAAALRASEAVRRRFEGLRDEHRRKLGNLVESLVENAVENGPEKAITVTLSLSAYSIRGEVAGSVSPSTNVSLLRSRAGRNGHGRVSNGDGGSVALLESLCSRWAIYQGTTDVWFEISLVP